MWVRAVNQGQLTCGHVPSGPSWIEWFVDCDRSITMDSKGFACELCAVFGPFPPTQVEPGNDTDPSTCYMCEFPAPCPVRP